MHEPKKEPGPKFGARHCLHFISIETVRKPSASTGCQPAAWLAADAHGPDFLHANLGSGGRFGVSSGGSLLGGSGLLGAGTSGFAAGAAALTVAAAVAVAAAVTVASVTQTMEQAASGVASAVTSAIASTTIASIATVAAMPGEQTAAMATMPREQTAAMASAAIAIAAAITRGTAITAAVTAIATVAAVTGIHLVAAITHKGEADDREESRDPKHQCTIHPRLLHSSTTVEVYLGGRHLDDSPPRSDGQLPGNTCRPDEQTNGRGSARYFLRRRPWLPAIAMPTNRLIAALGPLAQARLPKLALRVVLSSSLPQSTRPAMSRWHGDCASFWKNIRAKSTPVRWTVSSRNKKSSPLWASFWSKSLWRTGLGQDRKSPTSAGFWAHLQRWSIDS